MAKDPAFLFYPGDWLGGTIGMTLEQKGAYMEILIMQFNRGHMTEHMIRHTIGHNWVILKDKFRMDNEGLWYNERLEFEKEARKSFVTSRRNNISGANQYTKKTPPKTGHTTSRMEDEDNNSITVDYKAIFEKFRKLYPGKKNGEETEFKNFTKKTSDWKAVYVLLMPALLSQIGWRNKKTGFIPEWKNLKTWINNRCWEEEPETIPELVQGKSLEEKNNFVQDYISGK